jgi:hypothetical protein
MRSGIEYEIYEVLKGGNCLLIVVVGHAGIREVIGPGRAGVYFIRRHNNTFVHKYIQPCIRARSDIWNPTLALRT